MRKKTFSPSHQVNALNSSLLLSLVQFSVLGHKTGDSNELLYIFGCAVFTSPIDLSLCSLKFYVFDSQHYHRQFEDQNLLIKVKKKTTTINLETRDRVNLTWCFLVWVSKHGSRGSLTYFFGDILVRQKGGIWSSEQGSDFCPLMSHMQVSPCPHVI